VGASLLLLVVEPTDCAPVWSELCIGCQQQLAEVDVASAHRQACLYTAWLLVP